VKLCPACGNGCEIICCRHPDTVAKYRCTHCNQALCAACVQHLRNSRGGHLKFCSLCSQPAGLIDEAPKINKPSFFGLVFQKTAKKGETPEI
jgi:hypothetical protein